MGFSNLSGDLYCQLLNFRGPTGLIARISDGKRLDNFILFMLDLRLFESLGTGVLYLIIWDLWISGVKLWKLRSGPVLEGRMINLFKTHHNVIFNS